MDEFSYTVRVHDEGPNDLWAEVEELPGVFVSGANIDEINEALEEAIGLYLSGDGVEVVIKHVPPSATPSRVVEQVERFERVPA